MANVKEIRTKISSVQSTQKITKAMEMVAASKMRKTQDRMSASRPYAETIREVISHVASAKMEVKHPFLVEREAKRVGYLVISTDRGLCGSLNINLFKKVLTDIKQWHSQNVESEMVVIGAKAAAFFGNMKLKVTAQVTGMGDSPNLADLIGPVRVMIEAYRSGEIDRIYIVNNKFINTMTQEPQIQQLLPLPHAEQSPLDERPWDYLYEPDPEYLLGVLLRRYIESQVYQGVVENLACEQAARMIAMKAATDNGSNLINDLQVVYNKVRQSSITNELIDIVSGANAVSG